MGSNHICIAPCYHSEPPCICVRERVCVCVNFFHISGSLMETLQLSMVGLYKLKKILPWTLSLMGKDKQNIDIQLECDGMEYSCGGNDNRVLGEKILSKNTPESSCISELKYHLFTNILFKNVVGFQS